MAWIITSIAVTAVAAGVSARGQYVAGKQQEIEFEKEAEEEKLSSEARELQRRQQLNKVLSSNILSLASSGISGDGTPQSISLESAKQASASEALEGLSSRLKQSQLRRQGKNVAASGKIGAVSTLLKGASRVEELL